MKERGGIHSTPVELERYRRQIAIEGFGPEGQLALGKATAGVIGLGGLGSAVSLYLAAAGIGTLRLVDPDLVETSNLNRQVIHWEGDQKRKKTDSAAEKLGRVNRDVTIEIFPVKVEDTNVSELVEGCTVIMDCLDNFTGRYVLNREAWREGIPMVHGACQGFEGRCTTIVPGKTPCFRCLYPGAPPGSAVPILGSVAGTVGTIQATEAVKFITGTGGLLAGRLLLYDGRDMRFDLMEFGRDPECPVCSHL